MMRFLLARVSSALLVLLGVSTLVFLFIHLIPGDPVEVMLGESAQIADRDALRHSLGLDQPLLAQYGHYMNQLLHADLGQSLHSREPITDMIAERLPATAQLAGVSLLLAILLALPLGTLAAMHRGTAWDYGAMGFSLLGLSIPNFWMGPMLVLVFSLGFNWLPISGYGSPAHLVLPALTLGTAMAAILARMLRATLLEVLNEDYLRTARAKGLPTWRVMLQHAIANALLPLLTLLGLQLGTLLAGAVITEMVFSWPGIGQLTIEAIHKRDYPTLQACVLLISSSYVLVNTLTDILYGWVDPRIRLAGDRR